MKTRPARETGGSAGVPTAARAAGSILIKFAFLGFRSQSLAPPQAILTPAPQAAYQAICGRLLRRLLTRLYSDACFAGYAILRAG